MMLREYFSFSNSIFVYQISSKELSFSVNTNKYIRTFLSKIELIEWSYFMEVTTHQKLAVC